mgnify:FL=1
MLLHNGIELCRNLGKIPVQIQCPDTDSVPAHLVAVIRLKDFIRCDIEQHTGNGVGSVSKRSILIFDVGENLVQIAGMERMDIILGLHRMGVVLGVNDENLIAPGEHDVAPHHRQQGPHVIVQGPQNPGSCRRYPRALFGSEHDHWLAIGLPPLQFI